MHLNKYIVNEDTMSSDRDHCMAHDRFRAAVFTHPLRLRCYGTEGHSILMCSPNALFYFSLFNLIHLLMEILFFFKVRLFIRHIKYVEIV